jgi:hypothetical protein
MNEDGDAARLAQLCQQMHTATQTMVAESAQPHALTPRRTALTLTLALALAAAATMIARYASASVSFVTTT